MESEKPEGKRLGMKGQGHKDTESDPSDDLHFKVNETPPPLLCLLLALQVSENFLSVDGQQINFHLLVQVAGQLSHRLEE